MTQIEPERRATAKCLKEIYDSLPFLAGFLGNNLKSNISNELNDNQTTIVVYQKSTT